MDGLAFLVSTTSALVIYMQLCIWDYYNVFLITFHLTNRWLLDAISHILKLLFE